MSYSSNLNGYRLGVMPNLYTLQASLNGCHATTPVPMYIPANNKITFTVVSDVSMPVTEDKITVTNASKSFSNGVVTIYNPTGNVTVNISLASYTIDLNNNAWVDSGTKIGDKTVYKSNKSYHVSNGYDIATINIVGYNEFTLYIRSYAESTWDYAEAFALDASASRGSGKFTTSGKQSSTTYVECKYTNIDGGSHIIRIMYSKDSSVDNYDDRGYFYIGE